jgi:hypothetical protein
MKTHRDMTIPIMEEDFSKIKTPRESFTGVRRISLLRTQERRFKTTISPNSSVFCEDLLATDLEFFEEELERFRNHLNSLKTMDDSIDETHVVEMENNYRKVLEMAQAMLSFSHKQMEQNLVLQQEIDASHRE